MSIAEHKKNARLPAGRQRKGDDMKSERMVMFLKELIGYVIVLLILLFIAKKFEWMNSSILDNVIGLALGWIVWRFVMHAINRKKK